MCTRITFDVTELTSNNNMKRTFFLLTFLMMGLATVSAQKFGYLNSNELLASMPDVKAADAALETYQKELVSQGQAKVKAFETNYTKYMTDVNEGLLSKIQMQEREAALGQEQQAIADFEKEVQLKVLQKREELLKPILNKVDEAIQAVGKEGGYTMIFDSGTSGAMLYAPEGENIIALIKAKLGIQ
ncbi:MAG: OmpH family outer membrane protein [Saprospiraceae bacterium]|nr:OmpH family outer membrane protein [Saprospiraceae bacterium]